MKYTKRIVCLANSRKISGRCIAGKEKLDDGYGKWIRPISRRPNGEISEYEQRFKDGEYPKTLDVITIPLIEHQPHHYQKENHLIDDDFYWEKEGTVTWNELRDITDKVSNELWVNGHSSYNGINDRIPENIANKLESSLLLVQPNSLAISVNVEGIGLNRLAQGMKQYSIALMCAEKDPITCHRMILICREMCSIAKQINHILANGDIETNSEAENRLLNVLRIVPDMFKNQKECIEEAYDKQGQKIAYVEKAKPTISS